MKDRILNVLMLGAVGAALTLTLLRGPGEEAPNLPMTAALPAVTPTASPHPADVYREERAKTREREEKMLLSLADSAYTDPESRALAQAQLTEMAKNNETELAVEAALAARGYDQGLCVARQGTVTVFFPREISAGEAALFLDIVREASGLPPEKIRLTGY